MDENLNIKVNITVSYQRLFLSLFGTAVILLVIDNIIFNSDDFFHSELKTLFDITLEANIPTWFSATQALLIGVVAFVIYNSQKDSQNFYKVAGWLVIGFFFTYMGIDDTAQIHERVATSIAAYADAKHSESGVFSFIDSFPSYYWQILFLPIFGAVGIYMLMFLFKKFSCRKQLMLFCCGIFCYVVAVGLDYFDGIDRNYDGLMLNTLYTLDELRHMFRAIEEFIEMIGTTFILMSLMHYQFLNEHGQES